MHTSASRMVVSTPGESLPTASGPLPPAESDTTNYYNAKATPWQRARWRAQKSFPSPGATGKAAADVKARPARWRPQKSWPTPNSSTTVSPLINKGLSGMSPVLTLANLLTVPNLSHLAQLQQLSQLSQLQQQLSQLRTLGQLSQLHTQLGQLQTLGQLSQLQTQAQHKKASRAATNAKSRERRKAAKVASKAEAGDAAQLLSLLGQRGEESLADRGSGRSSTLSALEGSEEETLEYDSSSAADTADHGMGPKSALAQLAACGSARC